MDKPLYIQTPIYSSKENPNVFYKMESFQPTFSFKVRGMEALCRFYLNQGQTKFIASSGGNAGYSLAYVCQKMGASLRVIVPETTSKYMTNKIASLNAEVQVHGTAWDEANKKALEISKKDGSVFVSPFDDPLLWKGHSSLIDECAQQMGRPDKVVVSVGGGGLLCGVLEGLNKYGWTDTKIITAETHGAASFYKSWKAGKIISLNEITTIANTLGAKKISEKALSMAQAFDTQAFLMSDADALKATSLFFDDYKVRVEPACGAALSVPYLFSDLIDKNESVLVIACGGANTPNTNELNIFS